MTHSQARRFLAIAGFELSLFGLASLLGALTSLSLRDGLRSTPSGWVAAVLMALALFMIFRRTYRSRLAPFRRIRSFLDDRARPLFAGLGPAALAVLAGLAGLGEEALFRGWLQPWLENDWGAWPACLAAAFVFGLAHSITLGYAVCATAIGIALGALQIYSEGWLSPAVAHALYDFLALYWYLRPRP
jgi:uncharacterized protein